MSRKTSLKLLRLSLVGAVFALSACVTPEPASRAATDALALHPSASAKGSAGPVLAAAQWNVRAVEVVVPERLHVSEANLLYPIADIVWRGDPRGDRHAQVQAIVAEAAKRATQGMTKGAPVVVALEMQRFHALTERARYTVGGSYGLRFTLTLRDAATGAVIDGPRKLSAGFPAAGGQKAIEQEARGLTEKVVIIDYLTEFLRAELSRPVPVSAPQADLISGLR